MNHSDGGKSIFLSGYNGLQWALIDEPEPKLAPLGGDLIKLQKAQLQSGHTLCRSADANQMWLFFHTAACGLIGSLR